MTMFSIMYYQYAADSLTLSQNVFDLPKYTVLTSYHTFA